MTVYENIALLVGIAAIFLIFFVIRVLIQLEKTLKSFEEVNKDVKEITEDVKEKSKKLDPAFDAVSNISKITTIAKTGYEFLNKRKEEKKEVKKEQKIEVKEKEKKVE